MSNNNKNDELPIDKLGVEDIKFVKAQNLDGVIIGYTEKPDEMIPLLKKSGVVFFKKTNNGKILFFGPKDKGFFDYIILKYNIKVELKKKAVKKRRQCPQIKKVREEKLRKKGNIKGRKGA